MTKTKNKKKGKIFRYIIQGLVLLFTLDLIFQIIPFRKDEVSIEAYCPFGGFASLYEFIISGGTKTLTHTHISNIIIFGIIILLTLFFRSGFCGWVCPFGTFQGLIRGLGKKVGSLSFIKPLNKRYKDWIKNNKGILAKIDGYGRYFKYFVLVWAILTAIYYSHLEFRDYDPFASILKLLEGSVTVGAYILIAVIILTLFIDRVWCRYACPLGATIGLIAKLSPTSVTRDENLCTNCKLCDKNCPMDLEISNKKHVKDTDCNTCLDCVDSCPVNGALDLRFNLPGSNQSKSQTIDTIKK